MTWEFIPELCPKCGRQASRGAESCAGCGAAIPPNPTAIHQRLLAPAPSDGFYWTRKSIPELQNLSKDEGDRIWKAAMSKAGLRWDVIVSSLALGAAPLVAGEVIAPGLPTGVYMLCMFLGVALASLFYFQWQVSILRPLMWEYLPGVCPHCGYNLKESPQRCPECGAEVARNAV